MPSAQNYLDRIGIDIAASHANVDRYVAAKRSVRTSRIGNALWLFVGALIRLRLREQLPSLAPSHV